MPETIVLHAEAHDSCALCGSPDHTHNWCPCNCLTDTNESCPIHSFGSKVASHGDFDNPIHAATYFPESK
jgi:RNA polymerase subunit RPABC4/transcription elongation factor Spt4